MNLWDLVRVPGGRLGRVVCFFEDARVLVWHGFGEPEVWYPTSAVRRPSYSTQCSLF